MSSYVFVVLSEPKKVSLKFNDNYATYKILVCLL